MSLSINGTTLDKLYVNGAEMDMGFINGVEVFSSGPKTRVIHAARYGTLRILNGTATPTTVTYGKDAYWQNLVCAGDYIVVDPSNYNDDVFYVYDIDTGALVDSIATADNDIYSAYAPIYDSKLNRIYNTRNNLDSYYFPITTTGDISTPSHMTGSSYMYLATGGFPCALSVDSTKIYFRYHNGSFTVTAEYDIASGDMLQFAAGGYDITQFTVGSNGKIFACTNQAIYYVYNQGNGNFIHYLYQPFGNNASYCSCQYVAGNYVYFGEGSWVRRIDINTYATASVQVTGLSGTIEQMKADENYLYCANQNYTAAVSLSSFSYVGLVPNVGGTWNSEGLLTTTSSYQVFNG